MIRCYITDRRKLRPGESLEAAIARNLDLGIEWIQVREKDLSARALYELTTRILQLPNPAGTKIIVNTRVDVAQAVKAHGVHLPSSSPAPDQWRSKNLLWGVSCHSIQEVRQAEHDGADYVLFGPVFAPLSKTSGIAPHGLVGLREAVQAVKVPVLALGGITIHNQDACLQQGAAGIAGITLFQNAE